MKERAIKGHRIERLHLRLRKFVSCKLLVLEEHLGEVWLRLFFILFTVPLLSATVRDRIQHAEEHFLGPSTYILMALCHLT